MPVNNMPLAATDEFRTAVPLAWRGLRLIGIGQRGVIALQNHHRDSPLERVYVGDYFI
jgi:hypothetical protein